MTDVLLEDMYGEDGVIARLDALEKQQENILVVLTATIACLEATINGRLPY